MLFKLDSLQYQTDIAAALTFDLSCVKNPTQEQQRYQQLIMASCFKKFLNEGQELRAKEEAISLFRSVNSRMGAINSLYPNVVEGTLFDGRVKRIISGILGPAPSMEDIFLHSRHSSGVSLGLKFIDTSLEAKMTFPLTGTSAVCKLWRAYKKWDFELYSQSWWLNLDSGAQPETKTVVGSRASIVPKTNKIGRLIAVEPTLNMFFQQGVSALMTRALLSVGLNVQRDPEKHRRLAYEGSITGEFATIDFSSMSDSLSLGICHALLPEDWYHTLYMLRCHKMAIGEELIPLNMMSTMGNATTFPLETLLLYAIAVACSNTLDKKVRGIGPVSRTDCHVFGDDCILRTAYAPFFIEKCQSYGFLCNPEKTFTEGPFRESCGGDFFHGRDVRPFYFKSLSAATKRRRCREAYLYTQINGVLRMYIKYFGSLDYLYGKALLTLLFSKLRLYTDQVKFVPEDFPEDSGITMLRDAGRLINAYDLNPSKISVDRHGTMSFAYLSYKFPQKGSLHEGIRYAIHKKSGFPTTKEEVEKHRTIRRGGYYVEKKSKAPVRLPNSLIRSGSVPGTVVLDIGTTRRWLPTSLIDSYDFTLVLGASRSLHE